MRSLQWTRSSSSTRTVTSRATPLTLTLTLTLTPNPAVDKKLIKHKNRYKSCYTEQSALKMLSSRFVCGLHYCFQSKDEVCLVLDLLHGGTLSYMLHQKKRISERYYACLA